MERIKLSGSNEEIIKETLPNGLEIYLLPNNNVKNFYMTFSTKFGSIYTEFKTDKNSYTKIPNGVAHFLEHLTFKMEDGDASDYFANLGSQSNAYTSFKVTCYEVFGYDKFKENLECLLDYVQTPYYTEELVNAEKGIICEEVKMYEDSPGATLSFALYESLFNSEHYKYLISGSVDDVKSTTVKNIEDAYNTFYHPSNMFVIITGKFNVEEALAIITDNQAKKEFKNRKDIKIKRCREDAKVVREYIEIPYNVEIPKINIGLKIPLTNLKKLGLSDEELSIIVSIIINSNFGRSSELRERLVSGNIITDGISISKFFTKDYLIIELSSESPYPERYIALMNEAIKNIHITKDDLLRKKRVAISNYILAFDDIEEKNYDIATDIINYGRVIANRFDIYGDLEYAKVKEVAKRINDKNKAIVVLVPKEEN